MRLSAIIHLVEEEPLIGELDGLPDSHSQYVAVFNPRRRDGRTVPLLESGVTTVLFSWHRISHIELLPEVGFENVAGFVRE